MDVDFQFGLLRGKARVKKNPPRSGVLSIGFAGIHCVKRRLTVYCLHQKQLVKHFQAAGMRCFDQHAFKVLSKMILFPQDDNEDLRFR